MELDDKKTGKSFRVDLKLEDIQKLSKNYLESPEELFNFINGSVE